MSSGNDIESRLQTLMSQTTDPEEAVIALVEEIRVLHREGLQLRRQVNQLMGKISPPSAQLQ